MIRTLTRKTGLKMFASTPSTESDWSRSQRFLWSQLRFGKGFPWRCIKGQAKFTKLLFFPELKDCNGDSLKPCRKLGQHVTDLLFGCSLCAGEDATVPQPKAALWTWKVLRRLITIHFFDRLPRIIPSTPAKLLRPMFG